MTGVAWLTWIGTEAVAVELFVVSVGVKVTVRVCGPAPSTVPAAGVKLNVPGTDDVASSCVALSAVPYVIAAGAGHVMVAILWLTVIDDVAVAPR